MAPRRKPVPCLTEEQRADIRRGWYPSRKAEPYPGEMEREHDWRVAQRSAATGLPINHRPALLEVAQGPTGPEQPEVLVRVPPENGGLAPGTAFEPFPEEVMGADEAVGRQVTRSRGWLRQGRCPAHSPRRARFGRGHRYLL